MRIVLSAGKRGHYYLTARALQNHGVLGRFITNTFFKQRGWRRRLFPDRLVHTRSDSGLSDRSVTSLWPVELPWQAKYFFYIYLPEDTEITGAIEAEIFMSCDCRDTDLWVKVLDVGEDGKAFNLMSPGLDVQRASLRDPVRGRDLLEPGEVYLLRFESLITSQLFKKGHRLRILVTSSFFPHFSRNLHTGESEAFSSNMATSEIRIHHDADHPSRLVLPVISR